MASRVVLHLIRHEKTAANVERKYIGWTDESILMNVQANFNINIQPNIVYGSDLKRCKQTSLCYFPRAQFIPVPSLRELNFGDFEMKTYDQLKYNEIYRQWIDHPFKIVPPNGEDFQMFEQRVLNALYEIVKQGGEYTFVVHGGVIRLLLAKLSFEEQIFQQVLANHRTMYSLAWDSIEHFVGGARCTSLSEGHITVNEVT
ncbi:histidine phosphatase family protein [Solibacillus sp. FSL R7-0682]|uniref:histidine phosphatase family protein n=1 Tax=Solibacillus sp. FSL R7-0682 TaxID=2921690 RepID=UPI0030F81CDF